MRHSRFFRSTAAWIGFYLLLVLPGMAEADTFTVTVDKVKVGETSKSSPSEVSAAESDVLEIHFSYEYEGDPDDISNLSWSVYIDSATDGALMEQGTFSSEAGSSEFTTLNVLNQQEAQGKTRADASNSMVYDYAVVVQAKFTERVCTSSGNTTNNNDDDDDDEDDDDNDNETCTESEKNVSAQFKVIIDSDPPSDVEGVGTAIPGENRLTISWDAVTTSQTGTTETDVKYIFCVKETGNATGEVEEDVTDETAEITTGEIDKNGTDEETEIVAAPLFLTKADDEDGDLDGDEDGDEDGDLDGDEDGDTVTDDDDDATDDDDNDDATDDDDDDDATTDDDDDNIAADDDDDENLSGCMNPAPDGVSGTEYTIDGLKNNVEYAIRIKAMDGAGNISANWSEPIYGIPQPVDDFWEACQRGGCDEDGGFCFIATAAYGHYDDDEVRLLRRFRDDVLMSFSAGRAFVGYYYSVSPPLARELRRHSWARSLVRAGLFPVVEMLDLAYNETSPKRPWVVLGFLSLAFVGCVVFYRRRVQG